MAESTAVLETQGAATGLGDDLPADNLPEESPPAVPDQPGAEAPESEPTTYDGLTPEEIAQRVREEARAELEREFEESKREALRRQREALESEQRLKAAIAAADAKLREDAQKATLPYITAVEERLWNGIIGDTEMTREQLRAEIQNLAQGFSLVAFDTALPASLDLALKDMGLPQGIQALDGEYAAGFHRARADRQYGDALRAAIAFVRQKQHEASIAWYERQKQQEEQAKTKESEAAAQIQNARRQAASTVQPTANRGGAAGQRPRTLIEAANLYNDGLITAEQYRAYKAALPR